MQHWQRSWNINFLEKKLVLMHLVFLEIGVWWKIWWTKDSHRRFLPESPSAATQLWIWWLLSLESYQDLGVQIADSGIFNSWKIIHLDGIWRNIQNQIKTKCSCQILAKHDFVWKIFFQDNYRQETVYSIHQMRMNRRIHLNVYQFYCIKTILFKCKIFKKVAFANRK